MTATDTYLVLRAFCDELARCGMRHACTSPGSRNTPLVLSLVREPRIETFSHIDERCAGFFALGAAKASGLPVAVTCTSGTATANLTPAVIEAHEAHVPLLALTADRPPELRDVGAGQTIDQLKLYGDAVKWFFEVGVHDATDETLRWIRTLACRAYATALDGRPGPVHLNFPLREPLVLEQPLPSDDTGRAADRPYVIVEPRDVRAGGDGDGPHPSGRVVIVAGTGAHDPAALASYAARQRIPVLADPLSGARRGDAAIAHYDLLLRERTFTDEHRPDFVLRVGELPTSKPLRTWLATLADVPQIAFDPYGTWHDPASVTGMRIHSAPPQPDKLDIEPGWLESWSAADAAASFAIDQTLG
ncbi:MAG TPA: 2-succinyl-5-enolpyruvyl-6-hydroxy-3-cyclohexene-1-carboxylic-acid synthase, partial [Solirubrobacteraceae bacterium]|nr:2-succinyl-5-enolpyruvyl-6-hydroxy-3-cyclohexene-1-carboxylic-acid synthase [Solirubrobacteraceae bacterium]